MIELITLTREQYAEDINRAAILAAETALLRYTTKNRPAVVTRAAFSKFTGLSKATVKNLIDQQRLSTTADGKYIPSTEIDRYLNK